MKLLNAGQIHQWDQFTIEHEPIASIDLMERASMQCTQWLIEKKLTDRPVKIFCGKGNNGGDGLAIARQLIDNDIAPSVYILEFGHLGTEDFQFNLQRLHLLTTNIHFIQSEALFPLIENNDLLIDALYGSGVNRPLEGLTASLVQHINSSGATVVSIDVPSGMFLDKSSKEHPVITAHYTLSFQLPKLCLLAAENAERFGEVHVLDIQLHKDFYATVNTHFFLTEKEDAARLYQPRNEFAHKGNFGHALLIAGSEGKIGAALLAAEACVRSGVGLLTVHSLTADNVALNARLPEAMTISGAELPEQLSKYAAIGIGCGLGKSELTLYLLSSVLDTTAPLVMDADALNILSSNKHLIQQIPPNTILTPHPKEFDRLFGEHENDFARWETAISKAKELNCVIVLKGHHTLVASQGNGYFNASGNAGLAKAGSGDTLTGIITALLAQKYSAEDAAKLGVYLHGLAADVALVHHSKESLLASDVVKYIGRAFRKLKK